MDASDLPPPGPGIRPVGIRVRSVEDVSGLRMHLLEASHGAPHHPCLLHGFPASARFWRTVRPALADAGYRVVAYEAGPAP